MRQLQLRFAAVYMDLEFKSIPQVKMMSSRSRWFEGVSWDCMLKIHLGFLHWTHSNTAATLLPKNLKFCLVFGFGLLCFCCSEGQFLSVVDNLPYVSSNGK